MGMHNDTHCLAEGVTADDSDDYPATVLPTPIAGLNRLSKLGVVNAPPTAAVLDEVLASKTTDASADVVHLLCAKVRIRNFTDLIGAKGGWSIDIWWLPNATVDDDGNSPAPILTIYGDPSWTGQSVSNIDDRTKGIVRSGFAKDSAIVGQEKRYGRARRESRLIAKHLWDADPSMHRSAVVEDICSRLDADKKRLGLSKTPQPETISKWIHGHEPPGTQLRGRPRGRKNVIPR